MILPNHFIGRFLLLSFLIAFTCPALRAQSVSYEIEEVPVPSEMGGFIGLDIFQDKDGFMWFGSRQGLYRYDGSSFKRYTIEPTGDLWDIQGSTGLVSDFAYSMLEDSEGRFWFSNYMALTCFDRKTEIFTHYRDTFVAAPVNLVTEDSKGNLWVGSNSGLSRFDKNSGTFRNYPAFKAGPAGLSKYPVYSVYEDSQGIFWVNYRDGGMGVFNRETGIFENIDNIPAPVQWILEDRLGRLWITTKNGLFEYNRESGIFKRFLYRPGDPDRMKNQYLGRILQDASNNFWINTLDEIYHCNENLEKLDSWGFHEEDKPFWMGNVSNGPRRIYLDNKGTLWFFHGNGIEKLTERYNNFTIYEPARSAEAGLEVTDPKNRFFISNRHELFNGYYLLDRNTHTYRELKLDRDNETLDIRYSVEDRTGTLWIATSGSGLYRGIIAEDGRIRFKKVFSNPEDSSNVPSPDLNRLFEDSKGRIWIEAYGHPPCYYDPEQDRIMHLVNNPESTDKLPGPDTLLGGKHAMGAVQGEMNSGILLASHKTYGIFAVIPPLVRVSEHTVMPTELIRFRPESGEGVIKGWDMYQSPHDSAGIIWTRGVWPKGSGFQKLKLVHPDRKNDFTVKSRIYSVKDGLPVSYVLSFLEDNHGNFWLGTMGKGLSKFDPAEETFTNYSEKDGIPGNELIMAKKSEDGELFFCIKNGNFISFYPDSIRHNSRIPPVVITDLKIDQKSISPLDSTILDKLVTYTKQIKLSHKQNNISFSYAALNYIQSTRNQYRYKLEGFNDDWIFCGNRTSVDYTNLGPGKYVFRLIGSNNDGVWNEEGAALQLTIKPPPWETVWAYIVYGFLLIGIILGYRRFLINRAKIRTALEVERVEKEKVRELDHMKSRFFANVSHEFRTPLTLILGPVEDLMKTKKGKVEISLDLLGMIRRNARRLQGLINQLLDLSKLETGKLRLQIIEGNLNEKVEIIVLSFLSLAERKRIKYTCQLPDSPGISYFDSDKIEKILTNLLSNAFKFTPEEGEIDVSLRYEFKPGSGSPCYAVLRVADSGQGIPEEDIDKIFDRFYRVDDSDSHQVEGSGIGLSLTRELVELCRGEISVHSRVGEGSTFTVRLPVSPEEFSEEEILTGVKTESPDLQGNGEYHSQVVPEYPETKENIDLKISSDQPLVLIVEDNRDLQRYISSNLTNNYRIITAENGKEGAELAMESIPDLIISDVMMPELDGMQMCRQLKTDERTNHIPIILLTARADRGSKLEGFETGADDYIIKPFDADELKVRVQNLIEQRRKLRDKFRLEFISDTSGSKIPAPDQLLKTVIGILENHMAEPEYSVGQLGEELNMSRAQLYRKISAVSGSSPNELLRMVRMKRAARLLHSRELNVTQVMYEVGIQNTSYFARSFQKYYGTNPSEYRKSPKT